MKFTKENILKALLGVLLAALGITNQDVFFDEAPRVDFIESITQTQPLAAFELKEVENKEQCTYTFIITGETTIKKSLDFDQKAGIPCGCLYDLETPYYVRAQKVQVKNYQGDDEEIRKAIKVPSGWEVVKWDYSQVWLVSKTNCKADYISDQPKDTK